MRTLIVHFQPVFLEDERRSGSSPRNYAYAYCGDKEIKRGDWALVHNGTNFGVVEIQRVIPGIDPKVTKHAILVLTQDEFEAYKERNKKIEELRTDLDELDYRLEQHKKLSRYEDLASEDPRAKTLLERLKITMGLEKPAIEVQASPSKDPVKESN